MVLEEKNLAPPTEVELGISRELLELVETAACMEGVTVGDFVRRALQTAVDRAAETAAFGNPRGSRR